jgi:hypothetical protein
VLDESILNVLGRAAPRRPRLASAAAVVAPLESAATVRKRLHHHRRGRVAAAADADADADADANADADRPPPMTPYLAADPALASVAAIVVSPRRRTFTRRRSPPLGVPAHRCRRRCARARSRQATRGRPPRRAALAGQAAPAAAALAG